jgi:hypothetical protein
MTYQQRFLVPTAPFFKKMRNACFDMLAMAGAIPGALLALPAILSKIAFYAKETQIISSTLSLATLAAAVQPPKKKKETGKPLSVFLLHFRKPPWYIGAYNIVIQQVRNIVYFPPSSDSFIGKLWRIPILSMAHRTASAEAEKLCNFRRYQFSVGEIFLIPWWYQFPIHDFFLIPGRYQFPMQEFFLIPQLRRRIGLCLMNRNGDYL